MSMHLTLFGKLYFASWRKVVTAFSNLHKLWNQECFMKLTIKINKYFIPVVLFIKLVQNFELDKNWRRRNDAIIVNAQEIIGRRRRRTQKASRRRLLIVIVLRNKKQFKKINSEFDRPGEARLEMRGPYCACNFSDPLADQQAFAQHGLSLCFWLLLLLQYTQQLVQLSSCSQSNASRNSRVLIS